MHPIRIAGLATYLPERMLSNAELPSLDPALSPEDMDRIGILRRGHAGEHEDVPTMGVMAAERALARAGASADSLDFVILSNWTERRYVPDVAPVIQHRLGARRAFSLDVCCACSGFVFGLSLAHGYLQNPRHERGLVVASDRSSRRVRPRSRGTLVFGDGAAAVVVERAGDAGGRIIDYELRTDGSHRDIMDVGSDGYLRTHIEQKTLNQLAGRSIAEVSRSLLSRNGLDLDGVDWIIPHSGTAGVQAMVAAELGVSRDKILTNLPEIGNVTSASIPAALDDFSARGTVRPGDTILSVSVGLGWHYAAVLYKL